MHKTGLQIAILISLSSVALVGCDASRDTNSNAAKEAADLDDAQDREHIEQYHQLTTQADAAWGDWALEAATLNGEPLPEAVTKTITLSMSTSGYVASVGGEADQGSLILRRERVPMEIDITGTAGPNAGKTILAIFEEPAEDTLVICYGLKNPERPSEFKSTAENGNYLAKYKRKSPK